MNEEKYPIGKFILFAFISAFIAWCFFWVKGFAYDLEIGNYDFNGFDANADTIFIEWLESNSDYDYRDTENLINILKVNGYTEEYINQFKIKAQTTYNEVGSITGSENPLDGSSEPDMLTTENGATDAIVSDENMQGITLDKQNDLFGSGSTTDDFSETDTVEIIELLTDINTSISDLDDKISDIQYYKSVELESPIGKPIEEYTTVEFILLVILGFLIGGVVVFFCIKFVPSIGKF